MKKIVSFMLSVLLTAGLFAGCTGSAPQKNSTPDESLLLDANVLSGYLRCSLDNKSQPESPKFNYLRFIFSCFYHKDQPDFCYYDATPLTEDESLVINLVTSRKIMYQVFDIYWDITENVTGFSTKATDNNLLFATGFGWGLMGYYVGDYVYSEFSDNGSQVVSHFELFGPDWDADDIAHKSFGDYRIIFDIITENNETFLRFNHLEKE